MENLDELQEVCRRRSKELSPVLRKVALWMAENLPEVGLSGLYDIQGVLGVSSASIIRCTQRLGFGGYNDFQQTVRRLLPPSSLVWRVGKGEVLGTSSDAEALIDHETANLARMRRIAGTATDGVAQRLSEAREVLVTANLMSVPLGEYMAQHWNLIQGNVAFLDSASPQCAARMLQMGRDDLVIAMAFPRYSQSTLGMMEISCARDVPLVVITDEIGPVVDEGAYLVSLPVLSPLYFPSATAVIMLTQLVAQKLVKLDTSRALRNLGQVEELWEQLRVFSN